MIFLSSYKEDLHIQFVFPFKNVFKLAKKFPVKHLIQIQILPTKVGSLMFNKSSTRIMH